MSLQENQDTLLYEARKLNGDLSRHVKKCSFSNHLTGRFYQNNSMEIHRAKSRRMELMKQKRKQLEMSILLEDKKIQFLEEKLQEKREKRRKEEELHRQRVLAVIQIQAGVRMFLAKRYMELLKVEFSIMCYVAQFLQCLYRGNRDRERVRVLRERIIQHRKEVFASIKIQCLIRQKLAKLQLDRLHKLRKERNAATRIQARGRGRISRFTFKLMQRDRIQAAIIIQSRQRGIAARKVAKKKRNMKKKQLARAKEDRIPLHERRYSTYSIDSRRGSTENIARRRFSDIIGRVTGDIHDRKSSLSGLEILETSLFHEQLSHSGTLPRSTMRPESASIKSEKESSTRISTASNDDEQCSEKVRLARQQAAIRAAKQESKWKKAKEKVIQSEKSRKEELIKLEKKRKELLLVQQTKAKQSSKRRIESEENNHVECNRPPSSNANNDSVKHINVVNDLQVVDEMNNIQKGDSLGENNKIHESENELVNSTIVCNESISNNQIDQSSNIHTVEEKVNSRYDLSATKILSLSFDEIMADSFEDEFLEQEDDLDGE